MAKRLLFTCKTQLLAMAAVLMCAVMPLKSVAQDTAGRYAHLPFKNSAKKVLKISEVKQGVIQPYKPQLTNIYRPAKGTQAKSDKLITITAISPNPVDGVLKLSLHTEKECIVTVKIVDILSNDVLTLATERLGAGDMNKIYTISSKLSPGIYFVKVISGTESAMKRISVL